MNVFVLSSGQDTGGQGIRIKRAFDRHAPDWNVRAMHYQRTFIKYPRDLEWDADLADRLYREADVVHHKNGLAMYERFDGDQRKPAIIHHQGTRLRDHPREVNAEALSVGAVQLVSTVDLLADVDGGIWIPSPYDLDAIRAKYKRTRPNRRIRIGHAPTNRRAKGTEAILEALERVSQWADIEVDLIENVEWRVCLSRKGQCDIYIDQITHGYGNNSIECMAMGIPVISGWSDPADSARFMVQTGTEPPFMEANTGYGVEQAVRALLSAEVREEWGRRGRDFADAYHAEHRVVERLIPIYENAPQTKGVERLVRYDTGREYPPTPETAEQRAAWRRSGKEVAELKRAIGVGSNYLKAGRA